MRTHKLQASLIGRRIQMKTFSMALSFLLAGCLMSSTSLSAQEYRVERNFQYSKNDRTRAARNQLDVYVPAKEVDHRLPVVIYVHGGGWSVGNKSRVGSKPDWIVGKGMAMIATSYRFHPAADFTAQATDIAAAIDWTRKHADEYGFDAERIFLMGHSAGAHLVCLVGTDPQYLEQFEMTPGDLSGVISLDTGGLDIPLQIEKHESADNVALYEQVFTKDLEIQKQASPYWHLEADREYPPFLLIHLARRLSTKAQATRFSDKLNELDGDATVSSAAGKTHSSLNQELGTENDAPSRQIMEFLHQQLSERGSADTESSFETITVVQSGGFAGVNMQWNLSTDGSLAGPNNSESTLSAERMARLHELITDTDWSEVPASTRQRGTADDFMYGISIETRDSKHEFEIDGLSLRNQAVLRELISLVTGPDRK